jgi:predicted phosphodiesterase
MIYLTGDCHGSDTIQKLSSTNWEKGKKLSKTDYVIILGDFGLIWKHQEDKHERYWMEWLVEKPWTTLVVPGNHENMHRMLNLPLVKKFGSKIHKYNESIYIMKRGEIYNIDGTTIFNMGGAMSIDRNVRILGHSYWNEEIPTYLDFKYGLDNLENNNYKVDYILGHTTANTVIENMFKPRWKIPDPTSDFWEQVINVTSFKKFYFGHWHQDKNHEKYNCLYHKIIKIGENV